MDASENPDRQERAEEKAPVARGDSWGREEAGSPGGGLLRSFIRDALVQPGDEIGPYKLMRVLGEGGCGIVYLAEQSQPIRRHVALKVIKPGMDSQQVLARFEAEQQALARLEHPHVARVYDAGLTPGGRPYFVMEYVQGTPLTDYCDEHRLSVDERLRLFLHVCAAVQHAHQKGIIHRDLKPSNILVTIEDQGAVPKVIDFGVARAIREPLTEHTLYTEQGQLVGTPEYMSPEQADIGNQDIDTRTDVYSLGVVLYELLAGVLPYDRKAFREGGLEQMRKVIRDEEAATPSTRLSRTSREDSAPLAERRGMDVRTLCRRLHGDVDWITLKAMAKDRTQRYESVGELAADLRRHLSHEPVTAVRPSTTYRLRKFVRRNRALVTGLAAVLAVLTGGIIVSTVFAIGQARARMVADAARLEAERQTRLAQAITDFLNDDLLSSARPDRAKGQPVTIRGILDAASQKIEGRFQDEPLVEAAVRETLGNTYQWLGDYEQGRRHLERSFQLVREQVGAGDLRSVRLANTLGWLHTTQGRYEEAESLLVRTLEAARSGIGREHPETLWCMNNLAALYTRQHRYQEAEVLNLQLLEIRKRLLGEEHADTLMSMWNLAAVYMEQHRYQEVEPVLLKTLDARKRVLGEQHPDTLVSMGDLAAFYVRQHRYAEAYPLCLQQLELRIRVYGEGHPAVLGSLGDFTNLYVQQGRYQEAETLILKTLEIKKRVFGADHPDTLVSMCDLGDLFVRQGRPREAEALEVQTLEARQRILGAEDPRTLTSMHNLGTLYLNQGRLEEAEPLLVKALKSRERILGEEHSETLVSMCNLGGVYMWQHRFQEAESLYREVLEIRKRVQGEQHPDTLAYMHELAFVLAQRGRCQEAEALYLKTLEARRRVLGEEHPDTALSACRLGLLYLEQNRYAEAEPLFLKVLAIRKRVFGAEHSETLASMHDLAAVYMCQRRYQEVEPLYLKVLEVRQRVLGREHREAVAVLQDLIGLYEAWGKPEMAAKWRAGLPADQPAPPSSAPGPR